jgi:glutamyl-tRNA synthetase
VCRTLNDAVESSTEIFWSFFMKEVRTRFAPSPTGFQHLGGFRTAFFAWLLAKRHGGKFILRVEDTDQERSVPGAIRYILEELAWFGISVDEGPSPDELRAVGEWWDGAPVLGGGCGPYIQSMRRARYGEIAQQLVASGAAYRCDCTPEMLERERNEQMARRELPGYSGYCRTREVPADKPHTVRLKLPTKRSISFIDAVRGRVTWDNMSLRDPVLLKSDGFPTYHLAVVVDDHDMGITHALRGEEWLSSTPIHLLLYEALGWEPVTFAHLPVIKGKDGKKLSKRHGATKSSELRVQGYLSDALMNFVTLIGWSPGEGSAQEIFSREELIAGFALEKITEASGVFDEDKLLWMNGVYIRNLSTERFIELCQPFLSKAGLVIPSAAFAELAPHVRERVKTLAEVPDMIDFLADRPLTRDLSSAFKKDMTPDKAAQINELAIQTLSGVSEWTAPVLEESLRGVAEAVGMKPGPCFSIVRIAVTGKMMTPPLFESLAVLGKEKVLARLREMTGVLAALPR